MDVEDTRRRLERWRAERNLRSHQVHVARGNLLLARLSTARHKHWQATQCWLANRPTAARTV